LCEGEHYINKYGVSCSFKGYFLYVRFSSSVRYTTEKDFEFEGMNMCDKIVFASGVVS
jgi:hypothetical protein